MAGKKNQNTCIMSKSSLYKAARVDLGAWSGPERTIAAQNTRIGQKEQTATNRQEAGTGREIRALVRIAYPSKSNDQELLGNSYNFYLSVCVHAPCHANESRSSTFSWNFFSPSTFLWILGIDLRSPGLCFQPLCPLSWLSCWLQ